MNVLENNEELVYNENAMRNNNVKSTIIDKNTLSMKIFMLPYIEEFLNDKRMRSEDTYKNYQSDINQISKYFFEYDDIKYITKDDLEWLTVDRLIKFRDEMHKEVDEYGERKYSNATINRRFSSLKSLLKYLKARGKIDYPIHDLVTILKSLPDESEEIDILSLEDAMRCMEYFKSQENGFPIYLAAKISVDTALRAKEILKLQWNNFYIESDCVVLKLRGKGNKKWEDKISHEFYEELLQLKQENSKKVFNISYSFIAKLMNKVVKELNLDKNYTFHSFRKCSVTSVYELTGDVLEAQRKANHSNLNTTQRYLKSKSYGMTGVFSLGNSIDKNLYKEANKELLIEAIEDLGKDFIHLLNIKLSEKLNKIENNDKNS